MDVLASKGLGRRRLLALAALAGAGTACRSTNAATGSPVAHDGASRSALPIAVPSSDPSFPSPASPAALDAGGRDAGGHEVTARAWQAGRHPGDSGDVVRAALGELDGWIEPHEAVAVEAIDWPGAGAAVVAVQVRGAGVTRRLAVGVVTGGHGASPTGAVWSLPTITQDRVGRLDLEPVPDEALRSAAQVALAEAGMPAATIHHLAAATDRWPVVVEATVDGQRREVWLRRVGHDLVVAGDVAAIRSTPLPDAPRSTP